LLEVRGRLAEFTVGEGFGAIRGGPWFRLILEYRLSKFFSFCVAAKFGGNAGTAEGAQNSSL
jgi:hypothetical protein